MAIVHCRDCEILRNEKMGEGIFHLSLHFPEIARKANPGQFVMIRIEDKKTDPLLPRPMSIGGTGKYGEIDIFYRIHGRGSQVLSEKKKGMRVYVFGPLGRGFDFLNKSAETPQFILIAGGMGFPPLLFLIQKLKEEKLNVRNKVFLGTKSRGELVSIDRFKEFGIKPFVSTEDGSEGEKGLVTDFFLRHIKESDLIDTYMFACGPRGMLIRVAEIAKYKKIPCQVSLEERMACGMGVCRGCVVKVKLKSEDGKIKRVYKDTCVEGPVFEAEEILW